MRIKLGLKAWSLAPAMLFSLAVISGCNDETTPTTGTPPSTSPPPVVKPDTSKKPDTITPPAPPADKEKEKAKM